jgi:pullulanase-type alpha-1,6-glucosidase
MSKKSRITLTWLSGLLLTSILVGLLVTALLPNLTAHGMAAGMAAGKAAGKADEIGSAADFTQDDQPDFVGLPGTHQSELGCTGDWQPDCELTPLLYDAEDDVWQAVFLIQPGNDQDQNGPRYKVALNKSWAVNYGLGGQAGGADIPLVVDEPTEVKFYYDHKTHWVADSVNNVIATAFGTFQSELGCNNDDDPGCLRSWMQDPDGDGIYVFSTNAIPAGDYEVRVAINESLDETYGAEGAQNGPAIAFNVPSNGQEVYFGYNAAEHTLVVSTEGAPRGDLRKFTAHWVLGDTIAWNVNQPAEGGSFALYYSPTGELKLEPGKITGGEFIPLTFAADKQSEEVSLKFPHLAEFAALKIDPADMAKVPEILKNQVAVVAFNNNGKVIDAASLQIPGVLDDLYTYDGPLGIGFEGDVPTLRLWAPTARSVSLHLFPDSTAEAEQILPMTLDPATGVWSIAGEAGWKGMFYLYEVEVFVPSTGMVERNIVTDPYSISLSMNSQRSQVIDLNDPALQPEGWDALAKPPLAAFEDSVIYELHIRDFSISDESVPEEYRGTYMAFSVPDSNGMRHLKALADAGLTHIHLLPAFDIASIEENKSLWETVDPAELGALPPDSDQQALLLRPFRDRDGFNWGYDPYHYNTPEGSYATDPDGSARVLEFRQMVQGMNQAGLRAVMDVVYNHTNASGQSARSVLDKVVPGYYHRLNAEGFIERSTCCENTATEHAMMEKLMIDSVVMWAKYYKVDGFRFDLMGHHMVENMVDVRRALDALTMEADGVDGARILLYGEGWNFGEVANNLRGLNATQINLGGTGIATFNDRLRDAVRGGGPFNPVQEQGFITGLLTAPNGYDQGRESALKGRLLLMTDWIRIGLAGNLIDFPLLDARGNQSTGGRVDYRGAPTGYTLDPQEQIVYISAHDNETLFDAIQYKAPPEATAADRTRINNLGISIVMLSQGIPFFHAGDDLLRSKSLDGNSYNSGDWYNRLDFTYQSNNWAIGLPDFRQDAYELMRSLFNNPNTFVSAEDIQFANAYFREMLQIRKSSPLFRLQTAEQVIERLSFPEDPENRIPGLIVMALDDTLSGDLDPNFEKIVVAFNALPEPVSFTHESLVGLALELHPLQAASVDNLVQQSTFDSVSGTLNIPGRTTVVYVLPQTEPEPTATPLPEPAAMPTAEPTEAPTAAPTEPAAMPTAQPEAPTATPPAPEPTAVEPTVERLPISTPLPPAGPSTGLLVGAGAAALAVVAGLVLWLRSRRK